MQKALYGHPDAGTFWGRHVAKGIKSFKRGMSDDTSSNNDPDKKNSENSESDNK